MIYLILSVLCSTALGLVMKLFPRFGIDQLQAIVMNYATCVVCATVHSGEFPIKHADFGSEWWPWAVGLGLFFVTGFNGAALTVRYFGLTVAAVVQKMSIALSVPFAICFYQESAGFGKVLGILCALASIVLANLPQKELGGAAPVFSKNLLWLPLATFLLSVVIEVGFMKYDHENWLPVGDVRFIATIFSTAGLLGLGAVLWQFLMKKARFSWRNVAAGIILGIPNYGSILFIFLALGSGVEGSVFFPANNVGIIVGSALLAAFVFRERLSRLNWAGVALAVAAIVLIATG